MTETPYPTWTEERVEKLRMLFDQHRSASQMMRDIPGVSRNAIIGKLHRLGLVRHGMAVRQRRPKPARNHAWLTQARVEKKSKVNNVPAWKTLPMPEERTRPSTLYTLIDRPDDGCMYFYGDPLKDHRGYCGQPRVAGNPYCPECARICFDIRQPNERAKARQEREKVAA